MLHSLDDTLNFLSEFHEPVLGGIQTLDVVDEAIPESLRKVYRVFGDPRKNPSPICAQDCLAGPSELRQVGDFVTFLDESQGCWTCAYQASGEADPPVYLFGDDDDEEKQSESLERFLVTLLLQESVLAAPYGAHQEDCKDADTLLSVPLTPLWLEGTYSQPNPTHWFYASPDRQILAMRFDGDYAPWLWLGSYYDRWGDILRDSPDGFVARDPTGTERLLAIAQ